LYHPVTAPGGKYPCSIQTDFDFVRDQDLRVELQKWRIGFKNQNFRNTEILEFSRRIDFLNINILKIS